jgi:hypothetical protein
MRRAVAVWDAAGQRRRVRPFMGFDHEFVIWPVGRNNLKK